MIGISICHHAQHEARPPPEERARSSPQSGRDRYLNEQALPLPVSSRKVHVLGVPHTTATQRTARSCYLRPENLHEGEVTLVTNFSLIPLLQYFLLEK